MTVCSYIQKISPERIGEREARLSGRARESGPVEALKQMLFTMQDMAHHEDDNGTPVSCLDTSHSCWGLPNGQERIFCGDPL